MLRAGGLNAVLSFIDFFAIELQRGALQTAANMCAHVAAVGYHMVSGAIQPLSAMLEHHDRVMAESAVLCFSRLADGATGNSEHLKVLNTHGLLNKLLSLVSTSPLIVNEQTATRAIRVMSVSLAGCPALASSLHESGIAATLGVLLCGPVEITTRSARSQTANAGSTQILGPEQLLELVRLTSELLPVLPSTLAYVDCLRVVSKSSSAAVWEWLGPGNIWYPYECEDSRKLEASRAAGDSIVQVRSGKYNINVQDMVQINRITRTIRRIRRTETDDATMISSPVPLETRESAEADPREVYLETHPQMLVDLGRQLLAVLFDVYLSSASPDLLRSIMDVEIKLIHFLPGEALREILRNLAISSYIAGILAAGDDRLRIGALQIADILMEKLPDVFHLYFRRQGVMNGIQQLAELTPGDNPAEITERVIVIAKSLLDHHFDTANEDTHPALDVLRELKELSHQLEATTAAVDIEESSMTIVLNELAKKIGDDTLSMSSYEIWSSGLVESMLSFLTTPGPTTATRIKAFRAAFIDSGVHGTPALIPLIDNLQGVLNTRENFPCNMPPSVDSVRGVLSNPIKLRLERASSCKLNKFQGYMVLIEPMASIQTIEDFLWPKVKLSDADIAVAKKSKKKAAAKRARSQRIESLADCDDETENGGGPAVDGPNDSENDFVDSDDDEGEWNVEDDQSDAVGSGQDSDGRPRRETEVFDLDEDDTSTGVGASRSSEAQKATRNLKLMINGKAVPSSMTIYQALAMFEPVDGGGPVEDPCTNRIEAMIAITKGTHTLQYCERTSDDEDKGTFSPSSTSNSSSLERQMVVPESCSLMVDDPAFTPLALLRALHVIESTMPKSTRRLSVDFTNHQISSKFERQLTDLSAICVGTFPKWCDSLLRGFSFIIPFTARAQYFYHTAFGSARAMYRFFQGTPAQPSGDGAPAPGRLSRTKIRLSRDKLIEAACRLFDHYGASKSLLEVEFQGEIGTGLGPTLEFYTQVSKALQLRSYELWRSDSAASEDEPEHVFAATGLYPQPIAPGKQLSSRQAQLFKMIGRLLARGLLDNRILDLPLCKTFYVWFLHGEDELSLTDVHDVDPDLGKTLQMMQDLCDKKVAIESNAEIDEAERAIQIAALQFEGVAIDDLGLNFTLPGHPTFELCRGGEDNTVDINNLQQYISLVTEATVRVGVHQQMEAVRSGFSDVLSVEALRTFSPAELRELICGLTHEVWTHELLAGAVNPDYGYSANSKEVLMLFEVMAGFDRDQQRLFMSFVTGSPNLPVGGLARLRPKLTVVRKSPTGGTADHELPSVMTCQNYLKLPPYTSVEVLRERVITAMTEGQGSFHLS